MVEKEILLIGLSIIFLFGSQSLAFGERLSAICKSSKTGVAMDQLVARDNVHFRHLIKYSNYR